MNASPPPRRPGRRRVRRVAAIAALAAAAAGVAGPLLAPSYPGLLASIGSDSAVSGSEAAASDVERAEPAARPRTYELPAGEYAPQAANGPLEPSVTSDLEKVRWRRAISIGTPSVGRLRGCVRLPASGETFVSWDPVQRHSPNRANRRCGTEELVRKVLEVAEEYAQANPDAPRMVVGDLSRPGGGDFGAKHGDLGDGEGHVSHENGLDADIYYPRLDGREQGHSHGGPDELLAFDRRLAQELVDRFVAKGATLIFVGPRSGLTGPPGVVVPLRRHEDHMHVRFGPRGADENGGARSASYG